jgi:hypothetical protein
VLDKDLLGGHCGHDVTAAKSFIIGQVAYRLDRPSLPSAAPELNVIRPVSVATREQTDMTVFPPELHHLYSPVTNVHPDGAALCAAVQQANA